MMKSRILTLSLALVLFTQSCSTKFYPLKGNYPETPIQIKSEKNYEEVWGKLVDLFAQKGLNIQVIDKASGLITSGKTSIPTTIEGSEGALYDNTAWIVIPCYKPSGSNGGRKPVTGSSSGTYAKKIIPNNATGDWNVRIKPNGSGTIINVNITNVTTSTGIGGTLNVVSVAFKSTGVFEKIISDYIK